MLIAPLELAIRNSTQEHDMPFQAKLPDRAMNVVRFRTFDADDDQQRRGIDFSLPQEPLEDPQSKHYVFVPAMLSHAQQKRLAKPGRDGTRLRAGWTRV